MNWTSDQQKIIDVRDNNVLVSAAAGSGKTAVLVERIIQMIFDKDKPINVDELLVVTFTNAAAGQMKDKIANAIEERIGQEQDNQYYIKQLNMIEQSNILTIDSFCYKIVKEYFHVLGLDPKIQIAEEADIAVLRQNILEKVMEGAYENNEYFSEFSSAYSSDKDDLAIENYILKLYELSESYSYPDKWLDNAKECLQIDSEDDFNKLPLVNALINDIHNQAECLKKIMTDQLKRVRESDGPKHYESAILSDIVLIDDIISAHDYRLFANIEVRFETFKRAKKGSDFDKDIAADIKNIRDKYKDKIKKILAPFSTPMSIVLEQYKEQEKILGSLVDVTKDFSEKFLSAKLENGVVGFSDIEHFALKILCSGTDSEGNPIPSPIAKELSDQYKEILIDEYQDSNYLQEDILKCVSGIYKGHNNMFMVGDVKQSIYAFRMARPDLFIKKYNVYENLSTDNIGDSDKGVKILLKNNFRSRANILEGINYIFFQIMRKELGGIEYGADEALVPGKNFVESDRDDVELLLGESKEVDYLEIIDNDIIHFDDSEDDKDLSDDSEHLSDEYIDVGAVELEASMVALRIKELMGFEDQKPLYVEGEDGKTQRPLEYKDIVILFRSPKNYQSVFSEILRGQNIPVKVQNENGYFDTTEIMALLSLLKVIDNPYNDVEYMALLRGFFGGLNSDELSLLSVLMNGEKMYYYQFAENIINDNELFERLCVEKGVDSLISDHEKYIQKIANVSYFIHMCREKKKLLSVSELLQYIYYDTGYFYYVEAMPEGRERSRNLLLLLNETRHFEKNGFKSLFDFLQFIDKLAERGVTLGGDPSSDANENVVRIMSVHKSKGLEFPVVFVSGTGKKFNLMDTKNQIIMHSDYYINAKYINNNKRYGKDTFGRRAIASIIAAESIAEEIRILYVALTRAKEKLIITGTSPDVPKLIGRYVNVVKNDEVKLDYDVIRNATNYLDFIVAAMMRNQVFHDAMGSIRTRYDNRGNLVSGYYELNNVLQYHKAQFSVKFYDFKSLVVHRIKTGKEQGIIRMNKIKELESMPSKDIVKLQKNLAWIYDDIEYTKLRSKLSVTEIKRKYENLSFVEELSDDAGFEPEKAFEDYKDIVPRFISDKQSIDAATKGTWMHKVMEVIDLSKLDSRASALEELERLYYEGYLDEETKEFINADKFIAFMKSELGIRMKKADACGKLFREKKFVIGVKASEKKDIPNIVVQGIIDAYFEEDGHLILVDYKTDKIKIGQEKILVERYRTQMQYYKDTLEQLTGKSVEEVYLYSFALDKSISL